MKWNPYDPTWLVNLAKAQRPEDPWVAESLSLCTQAAQKSDAYIYFVDASNPNMPGSEWQFETNIILEDPREGDIVLDVLKDKRIGGIEFLGKIVG